MNRHWAQHPPVHIVVAAYVGAGKKTGASTKAIPNEQRGDLLGDLAAAAHI